MFLRDRPKMFFVSFVFRNRDFMLLVLNRDGC